MHQRVRQLGFTLAELLVSLAVGSILLSVAVPSYSTLVRNARQVSTANELLSSLHLARDLAITRNVRMTVCPSASGVNCEAVSWNDGWIVFADADGNRSVGAGETIERAVTDVEALSISSTQFDDFLIYRPSGRVMVDAVAENTGELTLCDERGAAHARVLTIEISGRPRVSRERAGGGLPICPSV